MKRYIYKVLLLALTAILVFVGYGFRTYMKIKGQDADGGEPIAELPFVESDVSGMTGVRWTGYTQKMKVVTLRDGIIPVRERRIPVHIELNGEIISQISWQLRNIDGENLVHQETISNWNQNQDSLDVILDIPGIVDEQTEYYVTVILSTRNWENIYYYNRFIINPSTPYEEQLDFVKHFHNASLNLEDSSDLTFYLGSSSDGDNANLGYVTEQASKDQVMWSQLNPVQTEKERLKVVDFNDEYLGCYELEFTVTAEDENGVTRTYDAKEVYRVRLDEDGITLVDYVRTVSERFVPDAYTLTGGLINTGIQPTDEMNVLTNKAEDVAVFEASGNLWYLNQKENKIRSLVSFEKRDWNHGFLLMNLDEEGSLTFLLYGYMPEGVHTGKTGAALYQYDAKAQTLREIMFICYDKSADYLEESVKKLAYANNSGLLYLMLDDCLYSMSYISNESVVLAEGLRDYNYVLSDAGDMAAWNVGGTDQKAERIKLVNMRTGKNTVLKGPEGTYVKAVGFVGDDFIYAVIDKDNIFVNWAGDYTYAASYVVIVDDEMNMVREYGIDGQYFTDISLSGGMMTFECSEKLADGSFEKVGDDYMVNQQTAEVHELDFWQSESSLKEKELVLSFNNAITEGFQTEWLKSARAAEERKPAHVFDNSDYYYVYGECGYVGSYLKLGNAIMAAYEAQGYVSGADGAYLYKRKTTQSWRSLTGMTVEELQAFLKQYESGMGMDISGVSLERALSFLGSGEYWLYAGVEEEWVFITEFRDGYTTYMDVETGEETRGLQEDLQKLTEKSGNHYLVVPR